MSALADADEFMVELIDDVLPDFIQAHERPTHRDAGMLIARARFQIRETYLADVEDTLADGVDTTDPAQYRRDSLLASEVVMQTLNAVAMSIVWDRNRNAERTPRT